MFFGFLKKYWRGNSCLRKAAALPLALLTMGVGAEEKPLVDFGYIPETEPIVYVQYGFGEVSESPKWVAQDSVALADKLDRSLLTETALKAADYYLSLPANPENGCITVDPYYGFYGEFKAPEEAHAILQLTVVRAESGFGWGTPGTLFRGRVVEEIRSSEKLSSSEYFDFFMPTGKVAVGDKFLCPRDARFPDLAVGDTAILLVSEIFADGETLLGVGDGGVLTIREGKVLPQGQAFEELGELKTTAEALEVIEKRAGGQS